MNAWLVVLMIVIPIMLIAANVYILVYFQHEEDKWTSWIPKILVICGLTISEICVLMLPLDVGNRGPPAGGIPMGTLWLIMYITLPVFALVIIPWGFFWYDSETTEDDRFSNAKRIRSTTFHVTMLLIIFAILYVVGYIFFGIAEVKTQKITGYFVDFYAAPATTGCGTKCDSFSGYTDIRVSPILFLVTVITFVGYLLMCVFGGIGLITVPWDLILDYINRPRRISTERFNRGREEIGRRADQLYSIGQAIQERKRMGALGRKERLQYNMWRKNVIILEEDYTRLKSAHELKGLQILIAYLKLPLGWFCGILSIFWMLHILLYMIIPSPPTTFLNAFFKKLDSAWVLFGVLAYGLFAFYMLVCVIKGNFKFGMRFFFFIPVYPMKVGETIMNAFLFNVLLILVGAITVTQFCTLAFADYTYTTAVNQLFVLSIGSLRVLKYWFKYSIFSFWGIPFLTFIYMVYRPKDVDTTDLQRVGP